MEKIYKYGYVETGPLYVYEDSNLSTRLRKSLVSSLILQWALHILYQKAFRIPNHTEHFYEKESIKYSNCINGRKRKKNTGRNLFSFVG